MARRNPKVARSVRDIKAKYAELLDLYEKGEIDEEQYFRLKGNLVRKAKRAGIGSVLAQMERGVGKPRVQVPDVRALRKKGMKQRSRAGALHYLVSGFEAALESGDFDVAELYLRHLAAWRRAEGDKPPTAYEKEASRRLTRDRTYSQKAMRFQDPEVRRLYSEQLTDDTLDWSRRQSHPDYQTDDPFTDFMYPEGADVWFSEKNPRKLSKKKVNANMRKTHGPDWWTHPELVAQRDRILSMKK